MDDDPFAVVAPKEKKMSSYLKKSKESASRSGKCVETSSHGTNSTRSTTNSTLPSEDSNFFSASSGKSHDPFSKKSAASSGFNNSSSSGSADFDFGNGLEFGQQGFGDDGFGMSGSGNGNTTGSKDRKAQSSRSLFAAPDPFVEPPAAPKSMRNLGSSNDFDAFGTSEPKVPPSMREFRSEGNFDVFGSSDPFMDMGQVFSPFDHEEDIQFGSDGFNAFDSTGGDEWEKRENWKENGRSKSGDVATKKPSSTRRRGGIPRRAHSSSEGRNRPPSDGPSPRVSSRKVSGDHSPALSHKSREKSPRRHDHNPPQRTRSGVRASRRASVDNSGQIPDSEPKSKNGEPRRRPPPRRGSVGYTSSDVSLDPVNNSKIVPSRSKSSAGPAHRPAGGRRQRRASLTHTSSGSLDILQVNGSRKEDDSDSKEADWDPDERAKNQQKIMDMYRSGGFSSKNSDSKNDASIGDIGKHLDMIGLADEQSQNSGDGHGSRSSLRRGGKKKDKGREQEDDGCKEPNDRKDRTKGTLLERVAGDSSQDLNYSKPTSSDSVGSGGLSYSDRIMMAQQRSKRN